MTTFKRGDRVRIRKDAARLSPMEQPVFIPSMKRYIGDEFVLQENTSLGWWKHDGFSWAERWLEFATAPVEENTEVRFILQYELDKDPFETFGSMKEVEARIKELAKRADLKRESIKVYEIAKTYDVTLETRVIFGGTKVRIEAAEPHTKRKYVRSLDCSTCGRTCKDKRGLGVHEARMHNP